MPPALPVAVERSLKGHLLLEGGAEFGGEMAVPDCRAIELAGGVAVPVSIIPTAAAADNNHQRAGHNAVRWFRSLGATRVSALPLIDRASAGGAEIAETLRRSRLVFMLGGFPGYLAQALRDTPAWQAILHAYAAGAVVAGSSAGAMVLCEYLFDPYAGTLEAGLNLLPGCCVLPHHEHAGKNWATRLLPELPGVTLIGIDERTGMIDDAGDGAWMVYGKGAVTLYRQGQVERYTQGATLSL
jgi:cyanophycinase